MERLRDLYLEAPGDPGADDTVDRLFQQYSEGDDAPRERASGRARRVHDVVRALWSRATGK